MLIQYKSELSKNESLLERTSRRGRDIPIGLHPRKGGLAHLQEVHVPDRELTLKLVIIPVNYSIGHIVYTEGKKKLSKKSQFTLFTPLVEG